MQAWWLKRLAMGFLAVILVCATVVWIRRPDRHGNNPGIGGGDFAGCIIVGGLALKGHDIYRESPPGSNTWPPVFSLFCTLPAVLARPTPYLARGLWILLNYFLVWLVIRMTVRLVYGRALSLLPASDAVSLFDFGVILPVLLCGRFILSNFDHLQVNILIFALVLGALRLDSANRESLSGCCLAFASSFKMMPALFLPYFLFRRRFVLVVVAIAIGAILFLSPALVYGWARFADYVDDWLRVVRAGWGVGKMNQSMFAMLDRYLGGGIARWNSAPANALTASGSRLPLLAWGTVAGIVSAGAIRQFRGEELPGSPACLIEYSVVLIASDLFGPVAWKAYFVNLLLPITLLVALARSGTISRSARRVAFVALAVYTLLASIPLSDATRWGRRMEMMSTPSVGVLVVLFALLWLRPRVAGAAAVALRSHP